VLLEKELTEQQINELKAIDRSLTTILNNNEQTVLCSPLKLSKITSTLQQLTKFKVLGSPNALVAIFEFFKGIQGWPEKNCKGLARIVESKNHLFLDLSVSGLDSGKYKLNIHQYGDLSNGIKSAGDVYCAFDDVNVVNRKCSKEFLFKGQICDIVGKALCLENRDTGDAVCGILARSAGVFENEKRVCSCTGRTIWED
jgi:copper chaperone for superoxide dismutase